MYSNSMINNEKRKFQRISETLPVRFRFSDRQGSVWYDAKTQNISEGGLFVTNNLSLDEIGDVVHVDLNIDNSLLRIICQVAWVKRENDIAAGFGLKIIQIEQKHRQIFLTYIYSRVKPKRMPCKIKFLRQPISKLPDKERRCFQILDYIRRFGPVSKADICKEIDLNAVSVGKFIEDFLRLGIVFDCGLDLSSGGRRAQLFRINKDFGFILGIDVDRDSGNLYALVANMDLEIIMEETKPFGKQDDIKNILINFINAIKFKIANNGNNILGIGIGLGESHTDHRLADYLSEAVGLPVIIEEGFHLESFAQSWITRALSNKNILYIHSKHHLSLILQGDIYKPEREIENKVELTPIDLQDKVLALLELLGPDIVYISKKAEKESPLLKQALTERLKRTDISETQGIKVLSSDVDEKNAIALGAISLVMKEIFVAICG
ncbi:MAG: PilZ domain-containing protein [Candidatus Omnitrophota bacterium]